MTRSIDAVLFDYGGVLTLPVRDSIAAWLEADGIDPRSFSRTHKSWLSRDAADGTPIHRRETGELSPDEFDALLAAELTTIDGRALVPEGMLQRIFAGMRPDEEMFDLIDDLRCAGIRVGLLSNSWGTTYPRERIDALLDPVVISGEVGLRKPHAAIFVLAVARIGLPAGRILFIDDAEPNVLGAHAVGLQGLLHTDATTTRAALAALVPALPGTNGASA